MHWIDWLITIVPVVFVLGMAIYSRKYVHGVADYLAAGRMAGRYVIAVGGLESSIGIVTLVALVEAKYQTGYALTFWETLAAPVTIVMALTGYCVYRFRETKALSIGQFLEMRYSRSFRIFATALRTLGEMLVNAIGPAIAANFFVYFLGIPHFVSVLGITIPTYAMVVAGILVMALIVMWPGGRLALILTDCVQGLMSYPIFVIIVIFVLFRFSWSKEIAPVMMDRAPRESFLNPFDIDKLRDFNIFALVVGIISNILNRASWMGNDTSSAGRSPHEQKMAGILGAWRTGFSWLMCTVVAIAMITFMSHAKFATESQVVRLELADKVAGEVVPDAEMRARLHNQLAAIPVERHTVGVDKPLSRTENLDTPYMKAASDTFGQGAEGNFMFQKFRALYGQQMMSLALRHLLPVGMMGLFALLMVMLMLATDDSRTFNSSATIVQDVRNAAAQDPLDAGTALALAAMVVLVGFRILLHLLTVFRQRGLHQYVSDDRGGDLGRRRRAGDDLRIVQPVWKHRGGLCGTVCGFRFIGRRHTPAAVLGASGLPLHRTHGLGARNRAFLGRRHVALFPLRSVDHGSSEVPDQLV